MKPPAPGPVSVLSATQETKAAAMHASTALPPSASTSAPASAVSGCPAATAPLIGPSLVRGRMRFLASFAARGAGIVPALAESQPARPRSPPLRRRRGRVCRTSRLARPARRRSRRARLPTDALPAPRLRALEQLLVRGALQLRHLQRPLLPDSRTVRDQAARGRHRLHGGA